MTNGESLDLPTTPHVSEGPDNDGFFEDLGNTTPYLKAIFEGFPGGGKTMTMVKLAIGLHRRVGSKKPIVFISTEKAGKFLKPFFDEAGIRVLQRETRSPADLQEAMKRCRDGVSDVLCVDSISHIWEAFVEAYKQKLRRARLEMLDWGTIKPAWKKEITDAFVNDPYHCLMTGRAAYEYDNEERDDGSGKRDIYKSGIKMRAEGELAYEPDILILMSRHEDVLGDEKTVWREATILKDRSSLIDGKSFKNPGFETFAPAVDRLLSGAIKSKTTAALDATAMFKTEDDKRAWLKRRDIALETIEGELTKAWPGTAGDAKALKLKALEIAYQTTSWTRIQGLSPDVLENGLSALRSFIKRQLLIAGIDADLVAIWPGTSADARSSRRAALLQAFSVGSLDALEDKTTAEIEEGIAILKAALATDAASGGSDSSPTSDDRKPKGAKKESKSAEA